MKVRVLGHGISVSSKERHEWVQVNKEPMTDNKGVAINVFRCNKTHEMKTWPAAGKESKKGEKVMAPPATVIREKKKPAAAEAAAAPSAAPAVPAPAAPAAPAAE